MKDSIKNLANKNMVLLAWNFKDEIVKIMNNIAFKNKIILPINKKWK